MTQHASVTNAKPEPKLSTPRAIWLMAPAASVDATLETIL